MGREKKKKEEKEMPPRKAKRASPQKNGGKNNTATRKSRSSGNNNNNNHRNKPSRPCSSRGLPLHPPPSRLSKLLSRTQPPPASSPFTTLGHNTPNAVAAPAAVAGASQGFTYLSPQILAATRRASTSMLNHAATTSPTPPPLYTTQPHSVDESALARLRALASGSLLLSPLSTQSFSLDCTRNEESPSRKLPQQSQPQQLPPSPLWPSQMQPDSVVPSTASSPPTTPYTPQLVRRLAELNGTPYTQTLAALHADRLKPSRTAATATAAVTAATPTTVPQPPSLDQFSSSHIYAEEDEQSMQLPSPMNGFRALANSIACENEEEENVGNGGSGVGSPRDTATQPTDNVQLAASRLNRLRAAGRVGSAVAVPASSSTDLSNGASPPVAVDVVSRLAMLRRRLPTSPQPSSSTAVAEEDTSLPAGYFMNLERMRVGHGSANTSTSSLNNINSDSNLSNGKDLFQGDKWTREVAKRKAPPLPPDSIDAALHEADEQRSLEAFLQRYRDASAQAPLLQRQRPSPSPSHSSTDAAAPAQSAKTAVQMPPAASPKPKRATRRSQRRQSASAAKKESALATLVKGRRTGLRLSGETVASHAAGSAGLSSAQVVARLRSLAAPVPIGEDGRAAGQTPPSSPSPPSSSSAPPAELPPSWSSTSPFAALASPKLYEMLHHAAHNHQSESAGGETATAAGIGAATTEPPSFNNHLPGSPSPPDLRRRAAFSTSRRTVRDRPLPASAQCFVFDTSSLLNSEPGVLNLLLERAHIGIPFKVLDELDFMHKGGQVAGMESASSGGGGGGTHDREWRRKRAHELRNWIAACMSRAYSHLLLQKRTDVIEAYDRQTANNDDQILGYAVYLRQHRKKVFFVTEDKFLRIKAAAEIGRAYSYAEVRRLVGMPAAPTGHTAKRIAL